MLSLLLLLQLPAIFASGYVTNSKVCGSNLVAYTNSYGHELYYINGNSVDSGLFCEALQIYIANGCKFEGSLGSNHCQLHTSTGMKKKKMICFNFINYYVAIHF